MIRTNAILLGAILLLASCQRGPSSQFHDALQQKLRDVAGSNAHDCGRFDIKADQQALSKAGNCAMDAARKNQPFYVAYDLPGMIIAVAGNAQGQKFSVQSQPQASGGADARQQVEAVPCPAEIRVAASGRITCYAPGTFGGPAMGASPHGGVPGGIPEGISPHGDLAAPPAGSPNPHQGQPPAPRQD